MTPDTKNTDRILSELKKLYPDPHHYLAFDNPFQLLVATILSAQCTDERVNQVTKDLFTRHPGPRDFAKADIAVIEEEVRPTGFYRNKAKAIKAASTEIIERFDGEVPNTMEELVWLPGLASKSANAILQHGRAEHSPGQTRVVDVGQQLAVRDAIELLVHDHDIRPVDRESERRTVREFDAVALPQDRAVAGIKEIEKVLLGEVKQMQSANNQYRKQLDEANSKVKNQQQEMETLQADVGVDFLTKVPNRRSFDEPQLELIEKKVFKESRDTGGPTEAMEVNNR